MQTIKDQFETMLSNGILPVFEFKTKNNYITVDIGYSEEGIIFEFDEEGLQTYFSGNVDNKGGVYVYQFDEYFNSLDYYLQEIYQEIVEGFIIPNNIELSDE